MKKQIKTIKKSVKKKILKRKMLVMNLGTEKGIKKAERQKAKLEKSGYKEIKVVNNGFDKYVAYWKKI